MGADPELPKDWKIERVGVVERANDALIKP